MGSNAVDVEWSIGAEQVRDNLQGSLSEKAYKNFDRALGKFLEQITLFPESCPVPRIAQGREDVREGVFGEGYRLMYLIQPDQTIMVLALKPPGYDQALG